jgi:hypothetical protein
MRRSGRAVKTSQRGLVAGFRARRVVECFVVFFLAFALALARALDLPLGVVTDDGATPDETRDECFVR